MGKVPAQRFHCPLLSWCWIEKVPPPDWLILAGNPGSSLVLFGIGALQVCGASILSAWTGYGWRCCFKVPFVYWATSWFCRGRRGLAVKSNRKCPRRIIFFMWGMFPWFLTLRITSTEKVMNLLFSSSWYL